uniref:UBC core domain-containing protein n=2 Tax=Caenorhabditis japonica TaxID=281687 RepID=A0A8R1DZE7_CAEJA
MVINILFEKMSDDQQPGPSTAAPSAPRTSQSRLVRGRRPTNLPPDEIIHSEVKILRPSQVPQREPLAEYTEPEARRIIPKGFPIENLDQLLVDSCRNVIIPTNVSAEDLIKEAMRTDDLVSFRSTNFVEPDDKSQDYQLFDDDSNGFIRRNAAEFINETVYGCTSFERSSDPTIWDVVIEAPAGSIYEGSTFFVEILFNKAKPHFVPAVKFKTLMFHPSLGKNGDYDMRGLAPYWNIKSSMELLYRYLITDMRDLKEKMYNKTLEQVEAMAQPNIARLASGDWDKFEAIARELAQKMAGAHVHKHGKSSDAKMNSKFTELQGWARSPSPEIDI